MKAVLAILLVFGGARAFAYETEAKCGFPPNVAPAFNLDVIADNTTGFDISTFDSKETPPSVMTLGDAPITGQLKAVSSEVMSDKTVANPNGETSIQTTTLKVRFEKVGSKEGYTAYCTQERMLGE